MFANHLRVTLWQSGNQSPVPMRWLEQFFMRNFTGCSAFDETLVAGDGELEAGFAIHPEAVREQFEKWLRGRKMIPLDARLSVDVIER